VGKITSILVVANRDDADKPLLEKAVHLARCLGARIELFTCDFQHAYTLRRAYDTTGVEQAWFCSFRESCDYLETLCKAVDAPDVSILVDAVCASPQYEAVVDKVLACRPDLVIKSTSGAHPQRRFTLDSNDWELMRTCPATLLLSRGKPWGRRPRFTAMTDVSDQETPGLAEAVTGTAELVSRTCEGQLEVLYGESDAPGSSAAGRAARLAELAQKYHIHPDCVHVLSGDPERTLPQFAARSGCDAIVLGALSHRESLTSLVGQMTGRLVEALTCDFILVKPPGGGRSAVLGTHPSAPQNPDLAA
jgi:universal stress protein E